MMKDIFKIIAGISCLMVMQTGCREVNVGYLETRNARFSPDTMEIKAVLDAEIDAKRIKFEIPWQSTSIEGVQGTMPIQYNIREVSCDNGHPEAARQIQLVKRGVILVPWDHTLPPGRYVINMSVCNEGYTRDVDSVFTVIVK